MKDTQSQSVKIGWQFVTLLVALVAIGITAISGMLIYGVVNTENAKVLGPWGDFFGGTLNPFLTFLTFIGVLITVILQKIDLGMTREELRRSANALETQIKAIESQNFESTFFQMLNLHNSIVNSIDLPGGSAGNRLYGRDCFEKFYSTLRIKYHNVASENQTAKSEGEIILDAYASFWEKAQIDLGHYYRFLYNFIKFVKDSGHGDGYYIKLIRSQLSDQELLLLYYNCLSNQGANFKKYAEEFSLFDNMPISRLIKESHKQFMVNSAFESKKKQQLTCA